MEGVVTFHRASSQHSWDQPQTPCLPVMHQARIALPEAALPATSVVSCVADRLSCRRFHPSEPLALDALAGLLHLAYGQLGRVETLDQDLEARPVPSASGFYALELAVFARDIEGVPPQIYRFLPHAHALEPLAGLPDHVARTQIFLAQPWVADAAAVIVMLARPEDAVARYGERAYRYLLLECGHVGQNIVIGAGAAGLGCCPVGGFEDYRLCCALGSDPALAWPLYAMALGAPDPAYATDPRKPEDYDKL